jgi:hypothetical protein
MITPTYPREMSESGLLNPNKMPKLSLQSSLAADRARPQNDMNLAKGRLSLARSRRLPEREFPAVNEPHSHPIPCFRVF